MQKQSTKIKKTEATIALHDLTGFDGRCDAIFFSKDATAKPPGEAKALGKWRRKQLGLGDKPVFEGPFDLVVVGGGYAGMGAAISAPGVQRFCASFSSNCW